MKKLFNSALSITRSFLTTILFLASPIIAVWLTKNPYIGTVVFVLSIAIWAYYETQQENKHLQELAKDRTKDTICSFVRSFDYRKLDTKVIRAVYEVLQLFLPNEPRPFPIRAKDNLFDDLKLDEDDLDLDIVAAVAHRTGRSLDNFEDNPFYEKVLTPYDLVMFFNMQPLTRAV